MKYAYNVCMIYTRKDVVMAKERVNISLSPDTVERLKQYAFEQHKTVSQVNTDWTWAAKVKNEQIRGQISLKMKK